MPDAMRLVRPDLTHLPAFVAAVSGGWSPNTTRNTCAETLAAVAADPARFLAELNGEAPGEIALPDGRVVPRLPGQVWWLWDGGFAGSINLRHLPGTEALPPHVSGHIGYAVVPGRQGRGYATAALGLVLSHARALSLVRVVVTCDTDNVASRRVIERNGGVLQGEGSLHGVPKLEFSVPT